ncbi:MAG: hypothetical protein ACOC6F_03270, partial [bacterium]
VMERTLKHLWDIVFAGTFRNRIESLEGLVQALRAFELQKMNALLQQLSDRVARFYDQLNPSEPLRFTALAPVTDGQQRQVRVEAESYGKDINPVSCFSESHINCLGLSLYMATRLGVDSAFGFFLLDDPIRSMDEDHMDRLVDLLRDIASDRQLVVLTHQKSFADALDTAFRDGRYLKLWCGSYCKEGPRLEVLVVDAISATLERARSFARGTRDDRINESAGSIRKAVEAIVKELLVERCGFSRRTVRGQRTKLSTRLQQLKRCVDDADLAALNQVLGFAHAPHHDDPNWDIPPQRIEWAVERLAQICSTYHLSGFRRMRDPVGTVVNYLSRLGVAVVEVTQPFYVGDSLLVEGATTHFEFDVESIELNQEPTSMAPSQERVGVKVPDKARRGDAVYRYATVCPPPTTPAVSPQRSEG